MKTKIKNKSLLIIALLSTTLSYSSDVDKLQKDTDNLIMTLGTASAVAGIGYAGYHYLTTPTHPEINVQQLAEITGNFPADFTWGVSTASTQNEEDSKNNSWTDSYLASKGKSDLSSPGKACNSWTQWQDDIDKAVYLGLNGYRLSIEWSRVQPTADSFDQAAIDHYVEICKQLHAQGIAPMVCLHHYSDPIWFLDMGGFAQEENIKIFTAFCQKMYEALRPYVAQWIVISQPAAYAIKSYKVAMMPPFLKNSGLEDTVMLNLFKAHIQVYDIMHNSYNQSHRGLEPQIGLCHQINQMQPNTVYNPFEHLVANFADRLYNKSLLRFFSTGHFRTLTPMIDIAYIPDAPQKFDFFALSYYSPQSFNWITPVTPHAQETHLSADKIRVIDKQGMYDAITQVAKLNKPIYVVESGINPVDETQRILLLNSYLSAINQAIKNKYDVRGYYNWTSMDNYEWGKPRDATHFGLYKNRVINEQGDLDPNFRNHELMLKDGGKYYKNIIARQKQKAARTAN
ncbi:MAG: family 1 glycosylhydrolase [Candidatus Chromulinivorax sp.]|nr:family 1 glycosylhydrolase [Candidatus Chromulinivorax sp.]